MSDFSVEWLKIYYERLFPADTICKWLDHGRMMSLFPKRELSFTLENDIYIRYLSFNNANDFIKEVKRKQPHKIDIGAVYNIPPAKHNSVRAGSFKPKERELVFDIDLTDYEEVMGPKQDVSSIWGPGSSKWIYMSTAMKIVSQVLRDDFGYKNFVWVFSGRRGVHCWISDIKARQLTDKKRKSLMKYFTVLAGKKVELNFPLHPGLERFVPLLSSTFETLCSTDSILEEERNLEHILGMIPDTELRETIQQHFKDESTNDSLTKWKQITSTVLDKANKLLAKSPYSKEGKALKGSLTNILFFYCYPRLDVNVSTHRNHLLKSPFCAHPKTGKICVPIAESEFDSFDPEDVPTLRSLLEELNEKKPSSLTGYIEAFDSQLIPDERTKPLYEAKDNNLMEDIEYGTEVPSW